MTAQNQTAGSFPESEDIFSHARETEIYEAVIDAYGQREIEYLAISILCDLTGALSRKDRNNLQTAIARAHTALSMLELIFGEDAEAEIEALRMLEKEAHERKQIMDRLKNRYSSHD